MRITTEAKTLADALTRVKPGVGKSAITALTGVLIDAGAGGVRLTTCNMELTVRQRLAAEADGETSTLVPHAELAKAAKALNGREITIEPGPKGLVIAGGKRRLTIPTLELEDFPSTDFEPGTVLIHAEGDVLAGYIEKILPYVGKDDTRPALTAAKLECGKAQLSDGAREIVPLGARFIGTDSWRLGLIPMPNVEAPLADGRSARIPRVALATAAKLMKKAATVGVTTDDPLADDGARQRTVIDIDNGATQIVTVVQEGRFPNWRQLVPDESSFQVDVTCPKDKLAEATGVAKTLIPRGPVVLTLNGTVNLSSRNTPDEVDFHEEIEGASFTDLKPDDHAESDATAIAEYEERVRQARREAPRRIGQAIAHRFKEMAYEAVAERTGQRTIAIYDERGQRFEKPSPLPRYEPPRPAATFMPFSIGFSPEFLADLASRLDGEEIRIRLIGAHRPGWFEGETERVLLMPIRLS